MAETEKASIEEVREFLCSYQLCLDMLNLRKYERKRASRFEDVCVCEDILAGDEAYWRVRMYEVSALLGRMKNGHEKLILYYHYVRGESIERAANLLGVSRRTGYRWHARGLCMAARLYAKRDC
ncbi:MAG: sigma-70 family RNA polymerase sigma factor [Clostridia bacterium]|nr:sigma-70 family RNA polymerase sigma factor [Clostridia bacterium]